MRKTFKLIITNFILIFMLVILTSGIIFAADSWDVQLSVERNSNDYIESYSFKILKNGSAVSIEEMSDFSIILSNPSSVYAQAVDIYIEEGNIQTGLENATVTYNSSNKSFKVVPYDASQALGNNSQSINVYVEDFWDEIVYIDKVVAIPASQAISGATFKVIPNLMNSTYVLKVENTTFNRIGDFSIYFGSREVERMGGVRGDNVSISSNSYQPGRNLTIKQSGNGNTVGTAQIPNIKSLKVTPIVYSGVSDYFDIQFVAETTNGQKVMSISDLKALGWKDFDISASSSGSNKTTVDFASGSSSNSKVRVAGNKIRIEEFKQYHLWIHNEYGTNVFKATFYAVDENAFKVELKRNQDLYMLYYPTPLNELEQKNAGKVFDIKITEHLSPNNQIHNNSINSNWYTDRVQKEQTFGEDAKFYLYEKVDVKFWCDETGLDVTVTLPVPQLDDIEDLSAKIIDKGQIQIFNKNTGTLVNIKELDKILGYAVDENGWVENGGSIMLNLCYDSGTQEVLDNGEAINNNKTICFSLFDSLVIYTPEEISEFTDEEMQIEFNGLMSIYKYWNAVKNSSAKDLQLYVQVKAANGTKYKINVTDPTVGNYRQFEAITGIGFNEFEEMLLAFEQRLQQDATEVTDGILHISSEEAYKDFYLPNSGVYYLEQQDDSGITANIPYICVPRMITGDERMLSFAGRFTGEEKDGKLLGEYIYYTSNTVMYGVDELQANCFPLVGGSVYRIKNNQSKNLTIRFTNVSAENADGTGVQLVEILNERGNLFLTLQSKEPGYTAVELAYILADDSSFFESLGSMLARFTRSLANGLNYLVQLSLQSIGGSKTTAVIDIDSIIFNHYPDTSIAFFNSNKGGESPSKMISMFKDGINKWYSVFNGIAIAGYIVILLYIGVRILLSVGSSKQAQFKEMLTSWVVGLILLMFFPYVVKYAIDINNMLVAMIEDSKTGALNITDVGSTIDMSDFSLPTVVDPEDYGKISSQMDKNPYADGDNSYMAYMARRTHENPSNVVDAVVYLIMVWQFIMIAIMYYKRVFVIAFLIAIFPFVALSYAIDKIGDGHAGAFNTWSREIMVNIFVQSIHALVYVFVIGATYQGSSYSGDWLLSIVGIMFLFRGEEILKKIIGFGGEGTMKSLGQTAKRAVKTVVAAKVATTSIANNVIGAKSHLGRTVNTYREFRKEKLIARNMDMLAPEKPRTPMYANNLDTYDPTRSWDNDYNQLAIDIQTLNGRNDGVSSEMYARALDNVMSNMNSTDINIQNLMQGLNLSNDQLQALADAQGNMVAQYIDGDKSTSEKYSALKESIDKELEARLSIIFPGNPEKQDMLKRAMYYRLKDGNRDEKHKPRAISRAEVEDEYNKAKERRNNFFNPTLDSSNPFSDEVTPPMLSNNAMAKRDSILSTYFNKSVTNATDKEKRFAESIAIMNEFSENNHRSRFSANTPNRYTAKQMMDAASYLAEHQKDSQHYSNAVKMNLGVSGKEAKSIIAEEIGKHYTNIKGNNMKNFREEIAKGAGFKTPTPSSGSYIEQKVAAMTTENTWRKAMEQISQDEKAAGEKHCYEETLDIVDIKDIMRKEREGHYDEATYIDYIVAEREIRNEEEIRMIEEFAREQLEDLPQISTAPTYEGLTKEEHEEYANDLRNKLIEEFDRTVLTTTGVVLGGSIGAGVNIGLSDDSSALEEAFMGATIGATAGDYIAERAMGRQEKVKKVKILNPYTGEIEDFELRKEGITKDSAWVSLVNNNEVLRYDDPRLAGLNYNLDIQFRRNKRKAEMKKESERRRNLYNEALRNNRNS